MARDVELISALGLGVGLELNHAKSELICSIPLLDEVLECDHSDLQIRLRQVPFPSTNLLPGDDLAIWRFPLLGPREASLLGAPLLFGLAMDSILEKKVCRTKKSALQTRASGFTRRTPDSSHGVRKSQDVEHTAFLTVR